MAAYGLLTLYNLTAGIGVSSTGTGSEKVWTYADLGEGIDNISEALNEVIQQYQFWSDKGFARNHVTGMAPTFTLTGKRVLGDTAQDYIFSKKYSLDVDRQSSFKLSYQDNEGNTTDLVVNCTICSQQEWSGTSTDDSAISFEIRFDGPPTVATTPASP